MTNVELAAKAFATFMQTKGLEATMEYLDALERGAVPVPEWAKMTREEFVECGRTGCKVYYGKLVDDDAKSGRHRPLSRN